MNLDATHRRERRLDEEENEPTGEEGAVCDDAKRKRGFGCRREVE
jgi:hypothetical protein